MNLLFGLIPDTAASALWAMVVASLLPWAVSIVAKVSGGFKVRNNAHPRDFMQGMTGAAARANAAQKKQL